MNQRINQIKHPLGIELTTPLLIPSYSSKGFAIDDSGKSELCNIMNFAKEFVYESQLVSAYDIYHKHMPEITELNRTQITLIDSGGYETSNNFDLSETRKYDRTRKVWNQNLLNEVIDSWPELYPAIVVSFDDIDARIPIEDQIRNAQNYFCKKKQFLSDFLIKPNSYEESFIDIERIKNHANDFSFFDIVGITEKELGDSLFERMKNIYSIRTKLDSLSIMSPIHIFGALDPLSVILYFIVGAEIFDGLSWLKYDYFYGNASYINNSCILKNIDNMFLNDNDLRLQTLKNNIYKLDTLKYILIEFSKSSKYEIFDKIGGSGFGMIINDMIINFNKHL